MTWSNLTFALLVPVSNAGSVNNTIWLQGQLHFQFTLSQIHFRNLKQGHSPPLYMNSLNTWPLIGQFRHWSFLFWETRLEAYHQSLNGLKCL